MLIYEAEKQAGLAELLSDPAKSCISFASVIEPVEVSDSDKAKIIDNLTKIKSIAKITDKDLYPLQTILVTTTWNKNDDVFTKEEVWAARHTPEDKPFNLGHDELDIIGHITANRCINDKYETIPDDTSLDLIPDKFHILTAAVLYRAYADEDRKDRIEKIIAEIPKGKWYVSMECYFQGFDYAVRTPNGNINKIIARSKDSAFLTQHLRAYGGDGEYDGYKIGRLMRNICFSGKGLVEKPANPESIILTDRNSTAISFASEILNIKDLTHNNTFKSKTKTDKGELAMAEANEKLVETLEKSLEAAKASASDHEAKAKELADKVNELEKANKTLASEKEDISKKYEVAIKELNDTKAAAKLNERVNLLVEAGLDKSEAEFKAKKFESVSDEMFSEIVDMAEAAKKVKEDDEKSKDNDGMKGKKKGLYVDKTKGANKGDDDEEEEDEDDDEEDDMDSEQQKKKSKKSKAKSDDDDDMDADEEDKKATDKANKSRKEASKMKKGKAANMGLKNSKEYDSGEENANDSNESDVGKTDDVSKVRKALSEDESDDEYEDSEAEDLEDLDLNGEAELDDDTKKVCAHVADYFDGVFGKKNQKEED